VFRKVTATKPKQVDLSPDLKSNKDLNLVLHKISPQIRIAASIAALYIQLHKLLDSIFYATLGLTTPFYSGISCQIRGS